MNSAKDSELKFKFWITFESHRHRFTRKSVRGKLHCNAFVSLQSVRAGQKANSFATTQSGIL